MATNPYSSPTLTGFNANPPADDGSEVSSNQLNWAKHISKIGDPLKDYAEAIDSAASTAFDSVPNLSSDEINQFSGSIAFASTELTISGGAVTATRSHHTIDTEGDAASDDLDSIATGSVADGSLLIIRAANGSRTVVVKHEAGGAGQIHLGDETDFSLDGANKSITLQRRGSDWYEVARSVIPQTDYILITDTKSDGTDGGGATSGSWLTRDLNTEDVDSGNHASVSGNQVTLDAGTYEISARAMFTAVGGARLRWRNTTDSSTAATSLTVALNTGDTGDSYPVHLCGRFTISAQKVFELQYFCEATRATDGLGQDDDVTAGSEIYAQVELRKVA